MTRIFIVLLILASSVIADVKSTTGKIKFDIQNDNQAEMTLNETGLGIGTTPSANLHVNGNAIVTGQVFVGGSNGSSNLNVNGTIGFGFQTVSSNIILGESSVVLADSSSDNITLTLPYAGNVNGRQYQIKKISTSNSVWISGGGNLIDDTSPIEMPESNNLSSVKIISDGYQWYQIEQKDLSETIASENLVGWWKLDELNGNSALDSSENSNHGTTTLISDGDFGNDAILKYGIDFDGIDDHIILPDGFFIIGSSSFSISAWVRIDGRANNTRDIYRSYGVDSSNMFSIGLNVSNQFHFEVRDADGDNVAATTTETYTDDGITFYHIIGVYNSESQTASLYVNSEFKINDSDINIDSINNNLEHTIGSWRDGGSRNLYWSGIIDDVRIYDKILTISEIQSLYNL